MLTWKARGQLWLRLGIRAALTALAVWLLVWLGPPLLSLFMPFVLAFVLAWLLNPAVRALQRHCGASRGVLTLLLMVVLFTGVGGLLFALIYNLVSELASLANNWQAIFGALETTLDTLNHTFSSTLNMVPVPVSGLLRQAGEQLLQWLQETLPKLLSAAAGRATSMAMGLPSFAVAAVMFMMGTYFMTADYPRLRHLATRRLRGGLRRFLSFVRATAVSAFGGYVKAQFILSIGVFFILLVGFLLTGQPYGLLLAFLFALLDFIPIVGAGTAMVPWAVVDLFVGDFRSALELMVIWGVIALFRRVGEPKVVGDQTGLSPILSLMSIYIGMRLGGVLGMILGPVAALVLLNLGKSGVFDGLLHDLSLAAGDLAALLRNGSDP